MLVRMLLMSNWRRIAATLMQTLYGQGVTLNDSRQHNIKDFVSELDALLCQFASTRIDQKERLQKLEEIIKRAARFGYMLYAEPTTWEFDWNVPRDNKGGDIVLFPALVQIGDDKGNRLATPRFAIGPLLGR